VRVFSWCVDISSSTSGRRGAALYLWQRCVFHIEGRIQEVPGVRSEVRSV